MFRAPILYHIYRLIHTYRSLCIIRSILRRYDDDDIDVIRRTNSNIVSNKRATVREHIYSNELNKPVISAGNLSLGMAQARLFGECSTDKFNQTNMSICGIIYTVYSYVYDLFVDSIC